MNRDADVVFQLVTSKYRIADRNRKAKYKFLANDPRARRGSEPLEKSEDTGYVKPIDLSLPGTPVSSRYISYLKRNRQSIETDSEDEDNDREIQIKNNTIGFLDESFRKFTENMKTLQQSMTFEPPENPKETVEQFRKTVKTKTGTIQEFTTYKTKIESGPTDQVVFSSKTLLYTESKPADGKEALSPDEIEKKLVELEKQIVESTGNDADSEGEDEEPEVKINESKVQQVNAEPVKSMEACPKEAAQNYFDESHRRNSYKRDFTEVVETLDPNPKGKSKPKPNERGTSLDLLIPGTPISSKFFNFFGKKKKKVTSVQLPPQNFPDLKKFDNGYENGVKEDSKIVVNGKQETNLNGKIDESSIRKEEKNNLNEVIKENFERIDENIKNAKEKAEKIMESDLPLKKIEVEVEKKVSNELIKENFKRIDESIKMAKEKAEKIMENDLPLKTEVEVEKKVLTLDIVEAKNKDIQTKDDNSNVEPKELKPILKHDLPLEFDVSDVKKVKIDDVPVNIMSPEAQSPKTPDSNRTRTESERSNSPIPESPQHVACRRVRRRSSVDEMEQYFIESGRRNSYQKEMVNQVQTIKNKIFGRQKSLETPGTPISSKYLPNDNEEEEVIDSDIIPDKKRKNSQVLDELIENYTMYGEGFEFKPKRTPKNSISEEDQVVEVPAKVIRFRHDSLSATTIDEEPLDHSEFKHTPHPKRRGSTRTKSESEDTPVTTPDSPSLKAPERRVRRRSSVDEMEQFFIDSGRRSSYQKEMASQVGQLQEKIFGKQKSVDLSVPGTTISSKDLPEGFVAQTFIANETNGKLEEAIDDMVLFGEGFKLKQRTRTISGRMRHDSITEEEEKANSQTKALEQLNEKSKIHKNIDLLVPGVPISASYVESILNEAVNEKSKTKDNSNGSMDDDIKKIVDDVLQNNETPISYENFKGNEKVLAEALINEVIEELNEKIDVKSTENGKEVYELKSTKILLATVQPIGTSKDQNDFDEADGPVTLSELQQFSEVEDHESKMKTKFDHYFQDSKERKTFARTFSDVIVFNDDSSKIDKEESRSLRSRTSSIASDISSLSNSDVYPARKFGKKKMTVDKYFSATLYKTPEKPQKTGDVNDDVD